MRLSEFYKETTCYRNSIDHPNMLFLPNPSMNTTLSLQTPASKSHVSKSDPSFVLVSSDMQSVEKIKERISKISLVSEVIEVTGMYDLVIKIESSISRDVKDVIAKKIRNIDGVRTCLSLFGTDPNCSSEKNTEGRT